MTRSDARKRLDPPTGPHAPALSEADREVLIDWWDSDWPDTKGGALGTLYAAARHPADEQPRTTAQHETEIGAAFLRGYDKGCVDGAASILARHPAEPSTPAPEATVAERTPEEQLLHDIFGKPEPHPKWPCPTPDCPGDGRYAAPGRGHVEGCKAPLTDPAPAPSDLPTLLAEHDRRVAAEALREAADEWGGSITVMRALEAVLAEHITVTEPEGPNGPYIWCACGWRSDDIDRDNPGAGAITHLLNLLHAATVEPIRARLRDRADRLAAPKGNPGQGGA